MTRTNWLFFVVVLQPFVAVGVEPGDGPASSQWQDRCHGMLIGSLIGDAMGGPVEFKSNDELRIVLPDLRNCSAEAFHQIAGDHGKWNGFQCFSYETLRPEIAPYGPWEMRARPGTVTDDSRHKMILMHCLREATQQTGRAVRVEDLCHAYVDYFQQERWSPAYRKLAAESFREYQQAARWILDERDLTIALPPSRIWAGISNCSGQMALLPLAAIYSGQPDDAYRATYALGFMDTGQAKDINSAMVSALAAAIVANHADVADRWNSVRQAIRNTDPYRYADVPFAKRPATEWLDFALQAVADAEGSPAKLYEILEQQGRAKYFWDAHFTYATTWAFLHFANYDPETAMLVSLAFGHDTDSTAQLVGALCGAVHGTDIFPQQTIQQVDRQLKADYGESVTEWVHVLNLFREHRESRPPVEFLEKR